MTCLIDTSVFITIERGHHTVDELVAILSGEPSALSSITAWELLKGVHRGDTTNRRAHRLRQVDVVLESMPVLPFDLPAARRCADLEFELRHSPINDPDLMIAAIALVNGFWVLTDNLRDFERVPGLIARRPSW